MSAAMSPTGKVALRVEVRSGADGYTQAALEVTAGQWMVLATIPTPPHKASADVRRKFIELAGALSVQVVKDALGGSPTLDSMHRMDGAPQGVKVK